MTVFTKGAKKIGFNDWEKNRLLESLY